MYVYIFRILSFIDLNTNDIKEKYYLYCLETAKLNIHERIIKPIERFYYLHSCIKSMRFINV